MTAPDPESIKARLTAATPGPWVQGRETRRLESVQDVYSHSDPETPGAHDIATFIWSEADAALIANAPADIAALLAENERLREAADHLSTEYDHCTEKNVEALWSVDQYKMAAENMTAERDALQAKLDAVQALADEWRRQPSSPQGFCLHECADDLHGILERINR